MRHLVCIISLALWEMLLFAQQIDLTEVLAEQLTSEVQESLSGSEIPEQFLIESLKIKNINKASGDDLKKIPWLTTQQIDNLLNYIIHNGPLVSIYELQAVPGWDLSTIRMTASLIGLPESDLHYDPRGLRERLRQDGGIELLLRMKRRLPLSSGFRKIGGSTFTGSPIYWLGKFRYRQKGILDIGITAEKDPGERFRWNPGKRLYGPDHLSMFLKLENKGPIKKLILGDFRAHWDQGLVLGSGFNFNKQVITGPRKVHIGIIPHTGTLEYDYYRGIGLEFQAGNHSVSTIVSYRELDARIHPQDSLTEQPKRITSVLKTGLHRTTLELERRMQLPQWIMGVHVKTSWSANLTTSISAAYGVLTIPYFPSSTLYNRFVFSGKKNINYSSSIEYQFKNVNFFGQFASSRFQGWAAIAGIISSLSHNVSMTIVTRNYHKAYHGIASAAFGKVSGNSNEQGIYWGFQFTPCSKWIMGTSIDFYRLPHPTFSADEGNHGYEQLIRVQYTPNKIGYLDLYWRNRQNIINSTPGFGKLTNSTTPETKHSLGLRAGWEKAEGISIQSRIQYSRYRNSDVWSQGMIVSNQVSYTHKSIRLTLSMAHFNTDDFENRQYIYEKDLPHSFSIPFFHGIGIRWFCLLQLKLVPNVDFWFKIAQSNLRDRLQLGNGVDTTIGPKRTDLSVQIRYKL